MHRKASGNYNFNNNIFSTIEKSWRKLTKVVIEHYIGEQREEKICFLTFDRWKWWNGLFKYALLLQLDHHDWPRTKQ
jgi:hypothetical protein